MKNTIAQAYDQIDGNIHSLRFLNRMPLGLSKYETELRNGASHMYINNPKGGGEMYGIVIKLDEKSSQKIMEKAATNKIDEITGPDFEICGGGTVKPKNGILKRAIAKGLFHNDTSSIFYVIYNRQGAEFVDSLLDSL
jgi:hypothetical protein